MSEGADTLEDIRAFNSHQGPGCSGGRVINALPPETLDKLNRALATPDIQRRAVWRWLTALGHDLTWAKFEYHVKGGCSCGR
jgi:hypothetical protein